MAARQLTAEELKKAEEEAKGIFKYNNIPNPWIEDLWLSIFNTDVKKDHESNYNFEVVEEILPRTNYNSNKNYYISFSNASSNQGARNRAFKLTDAQGNDKSEILNALFIRSDGNLSSNSYDFFNTKIENTNNGSIQINGTPFIYEYECFERNTDKGVLSNTITSMKNFMWGEGVDSQFIKVTDVTRDGNIYLENWGSNVMQVATREVENDAATKYNYTTGSDAFKDRFYIEQPNNNPELVTFPNYIDNSNNPLSYFYCKYDVTLSHDGLDYKTQRIKTTMKWNDGNKFVDIEDGHKKASKGKENLMATNVTRYEELSRQLQNSKDANEKLKGNKMKELAEELKKIKTSMKSLYIGKHHGDVGQVLTFFRPVNLTKFTRTGDPKNHNINSKDFPFMFESFDILACLKALSVGVDFLWFYPQDPESKKIIIFKLQKNMEEYYKKTIANKIKDIETVYIKYIYLFDNHNRQIDTVNTKRRTFIEIALREMNEIVSGKGEKEEKYRNLLKKGIEIADLSSYLPKKELVKFEDAIKDDVKTRKTQIITNNEYKTDKSGEENTLKINALRNIYSEIQSKIQEIESTKIGYEKPVYEGKTGSEKLVSVKISTQFEFMRVVKEIKMSITNIFNPITLGFVDTSDAGKNKDFQGTHDVKERTASKMSSKWGIDIIDYIFKTLCAFQPVAPADETNLETKKRELSDAIIKYRNSLIGVEDVLKNLEIARNHYKEELRNSLKQDATQKTLADRFRTNLYNLFINPLSETDRRQKIYIEQIYKILDIPTLEAPPPSGGRRKTTKRMTKYKGGGRFNNTRIQLQMKKEESGEFLSEADEIMFQIVKSEIEYLEKYFLAYFILDKATTDIEVLAAMNLLTPTEEEINRRKLGLPSTPSPALTPEQKYISVETILGEVSSLMGQTENSIQQNNVKGGTENIHKIYELMEKAGQELRSVSPKPTCTVRKNEKGDQVSYNCEYDQLKARFDSMAIEIGRYVEQLRERNTRLGEENSSYESDISSLPTTLPGAFYNLQEGGARLEETQINETALALKNKALREGLSKKFANSVQKEVIATLKTINKNTTISNEKKIQFIVDRITAKIKKEKALIMAHKQRQNLQAKLEAARAARAAAKAAEEEAEKEAEEEAAAPAAAPAAEGEAAGEAEEAAGEAAGEAEEAEEAAGEAAEEAEEGDLEVYKLKTEIIKIQAEKEEIEAATYLLYYEPFSFYEEILVYLQAEIERINGLKGGSRYGSKAEQIERLRGQIENIKKIIEKRDEDESILETVTISSILKEIDEKTPAWYVAPLEKIKVHAIPILAKGAVLAAAAAGVYYMWFATQQDAAVAPVAPGATFGGKRITRKQRKVKKNRSKTRQR